MNSTKSLPHSSASPAACWRRSAGLPRGSPPQNSAMPRLASVNALTSGASRRSQCSPSTLARGAERLGHVARQARPVERGGGGGHRGSGGGAPRGRPAAAVVGPHEQLVGVFRDRHPRAPGPAAARASSASPRAAPRVVASRTSSRSGPPRARVPGAASQCSPSTWAASSQSPASERVPQGLERLPLGQRVPVPGRRRAAPASRPAGGGAAARAVRRRTGRGSDTSRAALVDLAHERVLPAPARAGSSSSRGTRP